MNAQCGCGRAVEAKKTFEKISYSNTTERKLRTILGTIRAQLRDSVALTKARASEAVEKLRYKLDIRENNQARLTYKVLRKLFHKLWLIFYYW